MVYVRLEQEWTDGDGNSHAAGEMVDVDVSTLAQLEADGLVTDPEPGTDPKPEPDPKPDSWVGPTGGGGN